MRKERKTVKRFSFSFCPAANNTEGISGLLPASSLRYGVLKLFEFCTQRSGCSKLPVNINQFKLLCKS